VRNQPFSTRWRFVLDSEEFLLVNNYTFTLSPWSLYDTEIDLEKCLRYMLNNYNSKTFLALAKQLEQ
jgi:hypothetical protein